MFTLYMVKTMVNSSYKLCNPLNDELNPICHLLALLGAHHILHVSRIRVKKLNTVQWRAVLEVVLTIFTAYHHCLLRKH